MTYSDALKAVCEHFSLNQSSTNPRQQIDKISGLDERLAELLSAIKNAEEVYNFVYSDYEMRHKIKEVWEQNCAQLKGLVDKSQLELQKYCLQAGINLGLE